MITKFQRELPKDIDTREEVEKAIKMAREGDMDPYTVYYEWSVEQILQALQ